MQAVANKKVAYDLARFDRRTIVKEQISKEKTAAAVRPRTRAKSRTVVSGFAVFSSIVTFVMLVALLFSYVNLTEASDINQKKRSQLETLREQNQMLQISRDQRMGTLQIRDYAVQKLGMCKIDKSQITYVTTSGGDRFEVVGNESAKKSDSKLVTGLAKGFSTIIEYMN